MRLAKLSTKAVNLMNGALQFRRYEILKIICCLLQSRVFCILLLSVGLPVANAPDVLQLCGLLYYP